jgi:hypothetical protein
MALLVVACSIGVGLTPGPAPTEDAAAAYLADVVRVVLTGDLDRLCDLGGGTCLRELDDGGDSVPHTAPRLLGSVVVPATARSDGTWNVGGRLLRLCGIDGLGRPYYSEMLVFEDEGRLISREPVFWTGIRIETGPMVTRTPEPAPCPGA